MWSWFAQSQSVWQFLQARIPFDIAACVVLAMIVFSIIFRIRNRPEKTINDEIIKAKLEEIKDQPEELKLLWGYAMHADDVFNDRQNLFLVFESILLGGASAIISPVIQSANSVLATLFIAVVFLGLMTTISWWYTQIRQSYVVGCMTEFHKMVTPVYGKVIYRIREWPYRVDATLFLVYILPLLVACLWAVMLFIA